MSIKSTNEKGERLNKIAGMAKEKLVKPKKETKAPKDIAEKSMQPIDKSLEGVALFIGE